MAVEQPLGGLGLAAGRAGAAAAGRLGRGRHGPLITRPDRLLGPGVARSWRVVAASARGRSHVAAGLPCQDAHGHRLLHDGRLVAAVADGAGSAPRSADGARCAVDAVLEALAETLNVDGTSEAAVRAAVRGARRAVTALAAAEELPPRAFATTLTCAVVGPTGLIVGQVGDGACVCRTAPDRLETVTPPARGAYANETAFLTSGRLDDQLVVVHRRPPIHALTLTTDGLLRLALRLPDGVPHPGFFRPLLRFAARDGTPHGAADQLAGFLRSARVRARTDDDTTLLLAVRVPARADDRTVSGAA